MNKYSEEFVSGEKLISLCDVAIGSKEWINKFRNTKECCNNIIYVGSEITEEIQNLIDRSFVFFVKTDWMKYFQNTIMPAIKNPYVIVSHCAALKSGNEQKILDDKNLIRWFGLNMILNPKTEGLPDGLQNKNWPGWNFNICKENENNEKNYLLYINFTLRTNPKRKKIRDLLIKKGFIEAEKKPWHEYIKELSKHKFCISPPGAGNDCHRIWESIYVGCIPIVEKDTLLYPYFNELPILWVNDYNIIDNSFLDNKYEIMMNQKRNIDKAKLSYWRNLINQLKLTYRSDIECIKAKEEIEIKPIELKDYFDENIKLNIDPTIKKKFLAFGNEKYLKSRERIIKEAKALNIFDECNLETETVYEEPIMKNIISRINCGSFKNARGGGWWIWKPYIIYKLLKQSNDKDIIFYTDAGTEIINRPDVKIKFIELFNLVSKSSRCPTGIATFIVSGPPNERYEYMFNMQEVFEHFGVENNKEITDTQQVAATVCIFYKCDKCMEIVEKWINTAIKHPGYLTGDRRVSHQLKGYKERQGFRDHRHDQSIWSILCKLHGVNILTHDMNPIHQCHKRE